MASVSLYALSLFTSSATSLRRPQARGWAPSPLALPTTPTSWLLLLPSRPDSPRSPWRPDSPDPLVHPHTPLRRRRWERCLVRWPSHYGRYVCVQLGSLATMLDRVLWCCLGFSYAESTIWFWLCWRATTVFGSAYACLDDLLMPENIVLFIMEMFRNILHLCANIQCEWKCSEIFCTCVLISNLSNPCDVVLC